jgi:hypothetical protein
MKPPQQRRLWSRSQPHLFALGSATVGVVVAFAVWSSGSARGQFVIAPPAANLDQAQNGAAGTPESPVDWVNGNTNSSNSHYIEGYSIPYRVVMTDLPLATPIVLDMGYDIKHSGKHAIDYLTHYNRLEPHGVFAHLAEEVDPTDGVSGVVDGSAPTSTFPIDPPSSVSPCASPTPGQPTTSFNSLLAGETVMSLWNGTITDVSYVSEGCLTDAAAETVIRVEFTVTASTAVLAWGGHIGHRDDWGEGNSAGGISGSPYHMRLKDWNLNNLGNQDRSLSAGAVECFCCDNPCDDMNACTTDTCDEANNMCVYAPLPLSTVCQGDASLCTAEHCDGNGSCVPNPPANVVCQPADPPCEGGQFCDPGTGTCIDNPDGALSTQCEEDGDLCTGEHCDGNGGCVPHAPYDVVCMGPVPPCEAGQMCNPATGACFNLSDPPLSTVCEDDGNLCTAEHCDGNGSCVPNPPNNVVCQAADPPCEGGQFCDPGTGSCVDNPDAAMSTPCEEDGDLCTGEHCDGNGSCVPHAPYDVICQAPNPPCEAGQECNPSTGGCVDLADAALSTPCERDGNLCTNDHCDGDGSCVFLSNVICAGGVGFCEAGERCNESTGLCEMLPDAPLSTPCESDGDLCTGEHCDGDGSCVPHAPYDVVCPGPVPPCEAGQECNPSTGACVNLPDAPLSTVCEDDGNLCTGEHCDGNGSCVPHAPYDVICQAPDPPCEGGQFCDPGTGSCVDNPDAALSTPCEEDGDLCTGEHCDGSGSCVLHAPYDVICQAPNPPCEAGQECNPSTGGCVDLPDAAMSTPCDRDSNLCTGDHCDGSGSCVPHAPYDVICQAPDPPCEGGQFCDPGTGSCIDNPDGNLSTPCEDDGDLCTGEHCDGSGGCVLHSPYDVVCQAPDPPCEAGQECNPSTGICVNLTDAMLSTPCEDDGDCCTIEHCNGTGQCVPFSEVPCDPADPPCEAGQQCNPSTCLCEDLPDPALSTPCDADGNFCTEDHCDGNGACVLLTDHTGDCVCAVDCTECNPASGTCDPSLTCDGTICTDDGYSCTEDICEGGGCLHTPVDGNCDDGIECTKEVCNPTDPNADPVTGCVSTPTDTNCNDGIECTNPDTCDPDDPNADPTTGCVFTPDDSKCDDADQCTNNLCDPANGDPTTGCYYTDNGLCGACCDQGPGLGAPCEDGLLEEQCVGEKPIFTQGIDCDDPDFTCTEATGACCDTEAGPLAEEGICVDGLTRGECEQVCAERRATGSPCPTRSVKDCSWHQFELCDQVECPANYCSIPTVSEWGLVVLTLLLLIGAKVYFGRKVPVAA